MADPARLVMSNRSVSRSKAREVLIKALEAAGLKQPDAGWDACSLSYGKPEKRKSVPFATLIAETIESGVPRTLQRLVDATDPVFGGMLSTLATTSPAINISVTHGGKTHSLMGPAQLCATVTLLTGDILHHRDAACATSGTEIAATSRHFRSYVLSCCALVEAFLNTYVTMAKWDGPEPDSFLQLKRPLPIRTRLVCWLTAFAEQSRDAIVGTVQWDHFNKLRIIRNEIVHPPDTYNAFHLKTTAHQLNLVREGVGGLLRLLRQLAGEPSHLFIEQLRNAPEVTYQARTRTDSTKG
ncbi:MAG TPA: hypothetical protein VF950_02620 [Planctomycetota bacterium]